MYGSSFLCHKIHHNICFERCEYYGYYEYWECFTHKRTETFNSAPAEFPAVKTGLLHVGCAERVPNFLTVQRNVAEFHHSLSGLSPNKLKGVLVSQFNFHTLDTLSGFALFRFDEVSCSPVADFANTKVIMPVVASQIHNQFNSFLSVYLRNSCLKNNCCGLNYQCDKEISNSRQK